MNGEIDDVIAGDMVLTDIPVEGKCQIGNRPKNLSSHNRIGEKRTHDGSRGEVFKVKTLIAEDVGIIVQMPCREKGIGIRGQKQKKQQSQNDKRTAARM